jgi:hypothetical protein
VKHWWDSVNVKRWNVIFIIMNGTSIMTLPLKWRNKSKKKRISTFLTPHTLTSCIYYIYSIRFDSYALSLFLRKMEMLQSAESTRAEVQFIEKGIALAHPLLNTHTHTH